MPDALEVRLFALGLRRAFARFFGTLRIADGQESTLMRMNPFFRGTPWCNLWPEGIENGSYVGEDLRLTNDLRYGHPPR